MQACCHKSKVTTETHGIYVDRICEICNSIEYDLIETDVTQVIIIKILAKTYSERQK